MKNFILSQTYVHVQRTIVHNIIPQKFQIHIVRALYVTFILLKTLSFTILHPLLNDVKKIILENFVTFKEPHVPTANITKSTNGQ